MLSAPEVRATPALTAEGSGKNSRSPISVPCGRQCGVVFKHQSYQSRHSRSPPFLLSDLEQVTEPL